MGTFSNYAYNKANSDKVADSPEKAATVKALDEINRTAGFPDLRQKQFEMSFSKGSIAEVL